MDTVTGVEMCISLGKLGGLGILPRFNTISEQAELAVRVKQQGVLAGAAIGIKGDYLERATALISAGIDLLVIDVAHGHQIQVIQVVRGIKYQFPRISLVAGNVATYEGARDLFQAGADCVKVGIGPGAACITRVQTGCGIPQITAVMDAAKAARKFKKTLICDGGTKNSGDIVKGLAAGSHAVMVGSQLAGTDESPGKIIKTEQGVFKKYNGSASAEEKLRQGQKTDHIEGISGLARYVGPLEPFLQQTLAGIRSGFSYVGASNLSMLHKRAKFVQISHQGVLESNHHDVIVR